MSLLMSVEEADFVWLKEQTNASSGNISVQLEKLSQAEYIQILKTFKGKYPQTICRKTTKGITAFEKYVQDLNQYIKF